LGVAINAWRERERAARRRLIVTTARTLAEAEGWDAVTTRRLSSEMKYSQPVLYKHFGGMGRVAEAVAVDGFDELAQAIRAARCAADPSDHADDALTRVARAYLDFAHDNPAVYEAMFTRATTLSFGAQDVPPQLTAAFAELRLAVVVVDDGHDADALTEVVFAALHGLVALSGVGRLRLRADRVQLLVEQFTSARRRTLSCQADAQRRWRYRVPSMATLTRTASPMPAPMPT
jgi:AcrR family transcriptional regulator